MKFKRSLFVIALMLLFGGCFYVMNQHYDELARYPYELNDQQRELVLNHLDAEQINYLVAQKIEPEEFLPFIEIEGFELENTLWYNQAKNTRKEDLSYIVNFINKYRSRMEYKDVKDLLTHYSYNVLTRFYDEGYAYNEDAKLVPDPTQKFALLDSSKTVYTYEPSDLVTISSLPHDSIVDDANDIMIKKEVVKPLEELMKAAKEASPKGFRDMTIITGYLSYEDQTSVLESKEKEFEEKAFQKNWAYPGQSEYQLGYTITLQSKSEDVKQTQEDEENKNEKEIEKSEEEKKLGKEAETWIKENAYKYGFVVRYPSGKESITGKEHQPFTLRYVGKDIAKYMYDENKVMEEVNFDTMEK